MRTSRKYLNDDSMADDATSDLQSVRHYIAQDNVIAASKAVKRIVGAIEILAEQPGIGRQGRVTNTRELIVKV